MPVVQPKSNPTVRSGVYLSFVYMLYSYCTRIKFYVSAQHQYITCTDCERGRFAQLGSNLVRKL